MLFLPLRHFIALNRTIFSIECYYSGINCNQALMALYELLYLFALIANIK